MNKVKVHSHSPFQPLRKVLIGQAWDQNYFDNSMPVQGSNIEIPLPRFDITTTATQADQAIGYIRKTPASKKEKNITLAQNSLTEISLALSKGD